MECTWDAALLGRDDQLPAELSHIIQYGGNEQYLDFITRASLDARYTYILFAHSENIYAHICASLRPHGSLSSAVASLGRIIPFAPYLAPYAIRLLAGETYDFPASKSRDEDLLYLLGLFRLLRFDHKTFKQHVDLIGVRSLLHSSSRPIVYLAIRILQICLLGADHWFEQMVEKYLGEDNPDDHVTGQWDDKAIDYRFLSLWEEQRYEKMQTLLEAARSIIAQSGVSKRIIPDDCFHPSTVRVGNMLLPRMESSGTIRSQAEDRLVTTGTISNNLREIASALKSPQPLLLTGPAGSGKTLLARHIARRLGTLDKMVTLHLNEQSDAKLLIGIYTTGNTPGSFIWKPGVLTTAVQEGRWVLIEDLDRAPNEIVGTLLPLIERGELLIPTRVQTIFATQGFRILATVRSTINHRGEEIRPLAHMLGARHWQSVTIKMTPSNEQHEIAQQLFPSLKQLLPQFMALYDRLQASKPRAALVGQSRTGILRTLSPRDLLKWCSRVTKLLQQRTTFTSTDMDDIFMEAIDCFVGALPDGAARDDKAAVIAEELRIDPRRCDYLLGERDVRYEVDKSKIAVGRYSLLRAQQHKAKGASMGTFSTNPHTSRMLERVAAAVINREPLLLVGETGVGKTTAVQHLANHVGKKLEPFNLSQQSEAGDLLGGFKPVTARSLMVPMKDEFDELFQASFSRSKNQQFLKLLGKQMVKSNWIAVCKLWRQALKMVDQQRSTSPARQGQAPSKKRRVESNRTLDFVRWDTFMSQVSDIERRLTAGSEAFAFSFVEGNIVKAVRNGDWVLLDEINLASPDTLEAIVDLLDPSAPSLLLTEAGNIERIEAHSEFRVFAAMNPATDVGKKDLPPGVRSRFTELYVESPDKDVKSLQSIVRSYLRTEAAADPAIALDVSTLYQKIIALAEQNKLVDGAGQKPHFSLRTLTRTLTFAKYIAQQCSLRRALYEGFQMSFMTFLDAESARLVQPLLEQHLLGKRTNIRAELQKALRKPNGEHYHVQGYPGSKHWVRQGRLEPQEQPQYILTPFIKDNLENLVRAASTRQFPVLIQGPTSSGKTSMIEYLAKGTGHEFVRINNHEHTDLQEYLGTYVSGADGRLQFQEGILVRALREGHWIVLDELNLAPTDVLEALNRLLDDNRELLIPETQEVVRPHEDFMLFATQNPAGLYGGRKTLSRAFRNRFLELHFDDIPIDELQEILHRRTQLPESRCKRIVTVYKELSVLRQENRLFEQKSFATLRDLFRWALRPNDTIEQLAANGFMLLAERVRKPEERKALKDVIERVMSTKGPHVTLDEGALYAEDGPEIRTHRGHATGQGVVWTKAMRRLYVLVSRAIQNNEPVLLVGETGCGKTTVCQMLADALGKSLRTVNAHQNTETGDLIGSQRPVRNRAGVEAKLRQQLLASPLSQDLGAAAAHSTDALLEAYDQAVTLLNASTKQTHYSSQAHIDIQAERTRFKALFEWTDGSLVQAMKEAAFFLLDEISLADDSVLERINSVLEPQRSILLAEKASLDSFVTAEPGFQFFATMNPGGDYGKRELSPALRNRFTEIWVPSLSDTEDIIQIVSAKLTDSAKPYASGMVTFAQWFKDRYNTSASSSISVRDALAWVEFVNAFAASDATAAIVHGAAMVYIDTLGANPAGLMTLIGRNLDEERASCLAELSRQVGNDATTAYFAPIDVVDGDRSLRIGPFSIPSHTGSKGLTQAFTFDAQTTRKNTMRVVRAMQLSKPVMLEGSPGVGKTALVTAIATAAGVPLTRINLSEQTDLLDLFGSDAPVEGAATGTFAWRDAPFLRAMKSGGWVLLDEMNLASQSVLEGLNACLDHRGEVYVPELGQTFSRHPDFRLFAAQNPHQQGGGRKGLPASFVNRFTVVYADALQADDLMLICQRSFPHVESTDLERAVRFVSKLDIEVVQRRRFGANGGPWEFNLRDISRWLGLLSSDNGLVKSGNARDFVDFLFAQRFRSASDRAFVSELFSSVFQDTPPASDLFSSVSPLTLQLGLALLPRDPVQAGLVAGLELTNWSREQLRILESVMLCVQHRWPVILTGAARAGKTLLLNHLATAVGAPLVTIAMNAETDAMDLIGGYEQSDPLRQGLQSLDQLLCHLSHVAKTGLLGNASAQALDLLAGCQQQPRGLLPDAETLRKVAIVLEDLQSPEMQTLLEAVQRGSTSVDKARFEWTDGVLIDALQQGKWLVLDNANLCSSSVLDRLNSLLEPNGALIINEHTDQDGAPRVIEQHPGFRIFLVVDSRYGELSRAMRNRAVELYLPPAEAALPALNPLQTESAMAHFHQVKAIRSLGADTRVPDPLQLVLHDHTGIRDQSLLSRLYSQLDRGLCDGMADGSSCKLADAESDGRRLSEPHSPLKEFYQTAASQSHASADFACVQTVHPLNNQALVQQDRQLFPQASTLAFAHDMTVRLAPLLKRLSSLGSDQSLRRRLERIERSQLAKKGSKGRTHEIGILSQIEQLVQVTMQWAQQLEAMPMSELTNTKVVLYPLCALWLNFGQIVSVPNPDPALLKTWLSVVQQATKDACHPTEAALGFFLPRVHQALEVFNNRCDSLTGRACALLWLSFKPQTPSTMLRLNALLGLEELVGRFDRSCSQFVLPIDTLVGLRLSFGRSLAVAADGADDIASLTQKLEALSPATEPIALEEAAIMRPHFAVLFDNLCRHFATINFEKRCVTTEDAATLELFAMRSIKDSINIAVGNEGSINARSDFGLLRCALQPFDMSNEVPREGNIAHLLFQGLASVDQASLGSMNLLESENKTIGRTLATQAHILSGDKIAAQDACLRRLLTAVLAALVSDSIDVEVQDLGASLMKELNADGHGTASSADAQFSVGLRNQKEPAMTWFRAQLGAVIVYLRSFTTSQQQLRLQQSADAWASFAIVCLALYVPEQSFDPAMKPRLEREVHRQCVDDLTQQLLALQVLRSALTGGGDCLRARVLQEDVDNLGLEPIIEEVCRPEVSEMDQLQGEFDSLMRAVQPLHKGFSAQRPLLADDPIMWGNLERIRERLRNQYRAYDDLTGPVIGFIDCLRMSRELGSLAESTSQHTGSTAAIEDVSPFVNASFDTWVDDNSFLTALSSKLNERETLYLLSVLSMRSCIWPLHRTSSALRQAVDQQFLRFYQQWKIKLSDDQRRSAARSSLYRYKGDEDLQDDASAEQLEELFPTHGEGDPEASSTQQQQPHTSAREISQVHQAMFTGSQGGLVSMWETLHRTTELAHPPQLSHDVKIYVPAMIRSLQNMNTNLTHSTKPDRPYNIYTDGNAEQVKGLLALLSKTQRRFRELHSSWPEHATPVEVLRQCEQLLAIRYADPLTKFLPLLEKLHATVTEWQQIASREYSVREVLDNSTSLIISWRQLELSSWAGLLRRETMNCEEAASSWWHIAYENIVVASLCIQASASELRQHTEGLLKTLEGFLASCGLGEFVPRLDMLRNFEAHLASYKDEEPSLEAVRQALANFVAYHKHFEPVVIEKLANGRAKLEKDIKNVIQLASWKDRSVEVLRQSAKSSHKRLLRLVRKYRNLLAQPVASILQGGIPQSQTPDEPFAKPASRDLHEAADTDIQQVAPSQLPAWTNRPDRFKNISATVSQMEAMTATAVKSLDAPERLSSFAVELITAVTELQKATPSILTDENKALAQHLKTRKRRLLADVLKDVRAMGFQTSLSDDILAQQAELHVVLASGPALALLPDTSDAEVTEYYFHRLLAMMPAVREGARKHSDDLTPAEVARCLALLESMLQTSVAQRTSLCLHLQHCVVVQTALDQFSAFASCAEPTMSAAAPTQGLLRARVKCLMTATDTCAQLVQAQSTLARYEYSDFIQQLRQQSGELATLEQDLVTQPPLPTGIVSGKTIMLQARFDHVTATMQTAMNEAKAQHPEMGPVVSQLENWTHCDVDKLGLTQVNGYASVEPNDWVSDLLQVLDNMLASLQGLGHTPKVRAERQDDKTWLLLQTQDINRQLNALRMKQTCGKVNALLRRLSHLASGSSVPLVDIATVCRSIKPVLGAFHTTYQQLLRKLLTVHVELAKMAFKLATSFSQLAQQGFCSPSDKAESEHQKPGEVESGTGLGEGEGGEDISKDVGDDEDLSGLAQEAKAGGQAEDIEDEKDAVDMADGELEGQLGDEPEASQEETDPDETATAEDDIDEEAGEVDDTGATTVDEKMWDGGDNNERADKEAEDTKGSGDNQDLAAGKQEHQDKKGVGSEDGANDDSPDAEAGADEAEKVEQQGTDTLDSRAEEQQNLDLPEDVTMDGQKFSEVDSDIDALSDVDENEKQTVEEDAAEGDHDSGAGDFEDHLDDVIDDNASNEEASAEQAAGEDQDNDADAKSDILMGDAHDTGDEERADETMFGDTGTGADHDGAKAPQPNAAAVGQQDEDVDGAPEQEGQPEAGSSGQQHGTRADDTSASLDNAADEQSRLPYKRIGEVLDDWYKQHRNIDAARQQEDPTTNRPNDIDMAETSFEHLPDDETTADTQALGAASAEQSTALDEESGLPVNEELDTKAPPIDVTPNETLQTNDQPMVDQVHLEPSDTLQLNESSKAFVGEPKSADLDAEMSDAITAPDEEQVDDVDRQLSGTHLELHEDETVSPEEARRAWAEHEASTRNLALVLTEHLRLILQPTQATKMRGDFRTGKRLNIKRIIPYIASSYKRDKIWMRRSVPSKRSYQIMLAIDDSKSMAESDSRDLAFETLALIAKSMSMLEVGELSVVGFGEDVKVAHDISTPFTSEAGAEVFRQFSFSQSKTNVRRLLGESIELFRSARLKAAGSASELWQLQLIISDGVCEDHPSIRQLVRQAHEERIMVVFVVVDAAAQKAEAAGGPKQSILDLQTAEFVKDQTGEMQLRMVKYLDTFPFSYYLIVRDVQELPNVLAGALRQWLAEVVETGG